MYICDLNVSEVTHMINFSAKNNIYENMNFVERHNVRNAKLIYQHLNLLDHFCIIVDLTCLYIVLPIHQSTIRRMSICN